MEELKKIEKRKIEKREEDRKTEDGKMEDVKTEEDGKTEGNGVLYQCGHGDSVDRQEHKRRIRFIWWYTSRNILFKVSTSFLYVNMLKLIVFVFRWYLHRRTIFTVSSVTEQSQEHKSAPSTGCISLWV